MEKEINDCPSMRFTLEWSEKPKASEVVRPMNMNRNGVMIPFDQIKTGIPSSLLT